MCEFENPATWHKWFPILPFTFLFDEIIFSHTFFAIKNSFSNNFQIAKIRVRFETKKNVGRK